MNQRTADRKKILILFCGGTIVMKKNRDNTLAVPENREEAIAILRNLEPNLNELAETTIEYVANMDSTNMTPEEWDLIINKIKARYHEYDGFVLTHGTDTMSYTACALSVGLKHLGKPVVLTGSQIPAVHIENDARRNLVNALRVAVMDIQGVFIVFDERIIEGIRASKASESKLDAFTTVSDRDAGELRVNIRMRREFMKPAATGEPEPPEMQALPGFESDIFVYTLTPGCDPTDLEFLLTNQRIKGIIIRAYGTGNIPDHFNPFFRKARDKELPVIVASQCLHGNTAMESYEVGRQALDLGVIEGGDQSLEALSVKLMWALQHGTYEEIPGIIHANPAH